jgi:hypothetical protein
MTENEAHREAERRNSELGSKVGRRREPESFFIAVPTGAGTWTVEKRADQPGRITRIMGAVWRSWF